MNLPNGDCGNHEMDPKWKNIEIRFKPSQQNEQAARE
jgi:hypothetical protein